MDSQFLKDKVMTLSAWLDPFHAGEASLLVEFFFIFANCGPSAIVFGSQLDGTVSRQFAARHLLESVRSF